MCVCVCVASCKMVCVSLICAHQPDDDDCNCSHILHVLWNYEMKLAVDGQCKVCDDRPNQRHVPLVIVTSFTLTFAFQMCLCLLSRIFVCTYVDHFKIPKWIPLNFALHCYKMEKPQYPSAFHIVSHTLL